MELQKRIKKKIYRNWKLAYTHYVCKDGVLGHQALEKVVNPNWKSLK